MSIFSNFYGGGNRNHRGYDSYNERLSKNLKEGMMEGRRRGEELTGVKSGEIGDASRSLFEQYRKRANTPSAAAQRIRQQGQRRQSQLARRGGTAHEREAAAYTATQKAGQQEDADADARLAQYRTLVGNLMRTQSSLEPGYAQLRLAATAPPVPQRGGNDLGTILGGAGGALLGGWAGALGSAAAKEMTT